MEIEKAGTIYLEAIKDLTKKSLTLTNKDAVLTHYLHNATNGVSIAYRLEAIRYAKELLIERFPDNTIYPHQSENDIHRLFQPEVIPFPSVKETTFKFIDLFAGIGGFRLALQGIGGKCIYSSEFEPNAKKTYYYNFGEVPFGDITDSETKSFIPNSFDILCGGFPCQAFSIAGNRKGFADTRGTLFFDIEQIVEKHRPKVVFLENVKNLLSHDKGKTFKIILEVLEKKLGYKVYYKVLNSMTHANVPQNRERVFIVAFEPSKVPNHSEFSFPDEILLTRSIRDILHTSKQPDKYYYAENHRYYPILKEHMVSEDTIYQWRRVYVRENKSNVCPTLTANMGSGGHNVPLIKDKFGIRKLTPRECFLFQGFPTQYILPDLSDSKLYMQAGNSVTMPLIKRISEQIVKLL